LTLNGNSNLRHWLGWLCSGHGGRLAPRKKKKRNPKSACNDACGKKDISQVISEDGGNFPSATATVAPKITGQIKQLLVRRGTPVKEGQLLAVLEKRTWPPRAGEPRDFQQVKRRMATTIGAKPAAADSESRLDAASSKIGIRSPRKIYISRKSYFQKRRNSSSDLDAAGSGVGGGPQSERQTQRQLADLQPGWQRSSA